MANDLVDMMLAAAERQKLLADAEYEKALRLAAEQKHAQDREDLEREAEELRQALIDADVKRANTLAMLKGLKARNGTEFEDIRRHREILRQPFIRRSA